LQLPKFQRIVLFTFLDSNSPRIFGLIGLWPCRWMYYDPWKHRWVFTCRCCVTSQKTWILECSVLRSEFQRNSGCLVFALRTYLTVTDIPCFGYMLDWHFITVPVARHIMSSVLQMLWLANLVQISIDFLPNQQAETTLEVGRDCCRLFFFCILHFHWSWGLRPRRALRFGVRGTGCFLTPKPFPFTTHQCVVVPNVVYIMSLHCHSASCTLVSCAITALVCHIYCTFRQLFLFIHSVVCLTTGPLPLPKRFLHTGRYSASSFNFLCPLVC
jgi:hypothetical protein